MIKVASFYIDTWSKRFRKACTYQVEADEIVVMYGLPVK